MSRLEGAAEDRGGARAENLRVSVIKRLPENC